MSITKEITKIIEYQNSTIILGNFRKATVDELIEHFKTRRNNESKVF